MKEGVNKWITDNLNELRKTTKNIIATEDLHMVDDLLHEVIIMFIENKKSEELVKDPKQAKWFFIRILLNQYRSKTSYYHRKYRGNVTKLNIIDDITIVDEDEYDTDLDTLIEYNLEIIEEMLLSKIAKERYCAFIIMLYFSNGHNFAEVARLLDVKRATIRRQFDEGVKIIIKKMKRHKSNLEYNKLPIKILTTEILKTFGNGRRY